MIHYEVRKKIIEAWERGVSVKELKKVYGYGKTAFYNLIAQKKETGNVEPRLSTRGRKPKISDEDLEHIDALIKERPDSTLNEIIEKLDLPLSESRLSRVVREKLGYTYKKNCTRIRKRASRRTSTAGGLDGDDAVITRGSACFFGRERSKHEYDPAERPRREG